MITVRDISCDIWLFTLNDAYVDTCKGDSWILVWNAWFIYIELLVLLYKLNHTETCIFVWFDTNDYLYWCILILELLG